MIFFKLVRLGMTNITMASLWFHMVDKDVYTPFLSIEEAYFFGSVLVKKPISYTTLVYEMQRNRKVLLGEENGIQMFIYTGTSLPPFHDFPYGLYQVSRDLVYQHSTVHISNKQNTYLDM